MEYEISVNLDLLKTMDKFLGITLIYIIIGEMILFFGCRNKYGDDFFREDWNEYIKKANLKIFTAYSRDQVCFKFCITL